MKVSVKYTIRLFGLSRCPHEWDCRSLRTNSSQCSTCSVLFSIVRFHFACRMEWRLQSLARLDDYVHLLPTSDFFQDLLDDNDADDTDGNDPKTVQSQEVTIWSRWAPFEHPIVRGIQNSASDAAPFTITIEMSKPQCLPWCRKGTLLLNRWLQSSLAKQPGAIYSQLPDIHVSSVPETRLPTRVLDLMPDGLIQHIARCPADSPSSSIRLVVPERGTKGRYLTLSHRWGSPQNLRLTNQNLSQFKQGISVYDLPSTFRDAVMVATELGYRYLWIDALCIIQNEPLEWLEESAKMCAVYRNSCCTIAAHTSTNSSDGFLQQTRPTKRSPKTRFQELWKPSSLTHPISDREKYSVLNSRGWVFQERILSRRIFHFVEDGKVFFEDASGMFTDETKGIYDPQRRFSPLSFVDHPLIHDAKPNLEDVIEKSTQWYRLVERYTRCDLTYDSDRLPAVAGLADYYQELNGSQSGKYVFGLWMNSIHQGLLWVEVSAQAPSQIQVSGDGNVPQAPSWSWGLWKSPIRYPYHLAACIPAADSTGDYAGDSNGHSSDSAPTDTFITDRQLSSPSSDQVLPITLPIKHFPTGLSARRKARGITNCPSFPKTPMDNLYDIINIPSDTIRPNWAAFDGRRENTLQYDTELAVALVASNVKVDYFFWVEDEDNKQHKNEEHLYYFLVLERVYRGDRTGAETGRKRYRRIGVGAVRRTIWWKEEQGGRVEVVEIE